VRSSLRLTRHAYRWCGNVKADACTECGECEEKCTQKLKVSEEMAWAAKELAPQELKD